MSKICPKCNLINPDEAMVCDCSYTFINETFNKEDTQRLSEEKERIKQTQAVSLIYPCTGCHTQIRLKIKEIGNLKYPVWAVKYSFTLLNGEFNIFQKRDFSVDFINAIKLLDLDGHTNISKARFRFKEKAVMCHPDKVAGLDVEFRKLAEQKMQELNCVRPRKHKTNTDFKTGDA